MSLLRVHKFRDVAEMELFLHGGIIGGQIGRYGIVGLVGKTITFTTPNFSHTFVTAGREDDALLLTDIADQLYTASTQALMVYSYHNRLVFVQKTPTTGVALGNDPQPAKTLLGLKSGLAVAGKVYAAPGGAAPAFVTAYSTNDGAHTVVTLE